MVQGRCGAQARSACFPGALIVGGCTGGRPYMYDEFLRFCNAVAFCEVAAVVKATS